MKEITIRSGRYSEEVTPVPISNTVVKLFSADGSRGFASARVGRCQANETSVVYNLVINDRCFFIVCNKNILNENDLNGLQLKQ